MRGHLERLVGVVEGDEMVGSRRASTSFRCSAREQDMPAATSSAPRAGARARRRDRRLVVEVGRRDSWAADGGGRPLGFALQARASATERAEHLHAVHERRLGDVGRGTITEPVRRHAARRRARGRRAPAD